MRMSEIPYIDIYFLQIVEFLIHVQDIRIPHVYHLSDSLLTQHETQLIIMYLCSLQTLASSQNAHFLVLASPTA